MKYQGSRIILGRFGLALEKNWRLWKIIWHNFFSWCIYCLCNIDWYSAMDERVDMSYLSISVVHCAGHKHRLWNTEALRFRAISIQGSHSPRALPLERWEGRVFTWKENVNAQAWATRSYRITRWPLVFPSLTWHFEYCDYQCTCCVCLATDHVCYVHFLQ